jgi:allophanate hydrolase subunit 2
MSEACLVVGSCGPLVSYQDAGRFGMMRFGVPASGPMDRLAHAAALLALGRPEGSTAIEISTGGLELTCESGEVTCCVAGGKFQVTHCGSVTAYCLLVCANHSRRGRAIGSPRSMGKLGVPSVFGGVELQPMGRV